MQIIDNENQGRLKEHSDLTIENVDSAISYMKRLTQELSSAIHILPKVDEEGNSDCPFAEDLYAQKDEAAEKVETQLSQLQGYVGVVEQEIARCQANLDQINADAGRLNREEPKGSYASAGRAQGYKYENAIRQREALARAITMAEKVLALARSEVFPGRKPKKHFRLPPSETGGWGAAGSPDGPSKSLSSGDSLRDEIDNLISLGPPGRPDS